MNYFEVEKNLRIAIAEGKVVEIESASMDGDTELKLRLVIERILNRYKKASLGDCLFSCLMELATNGTKANMKHIFFEERKMDLNDPEQHSLGRKLFKEQVRNKAWMTDYAGKAAARGMFVRIIFTHTFDGLRIEVINNRPLLADDDRRIREKMSFAMGYDNIMDYFRDHADETEGAGLGFALSIIMMKGEGIDPSLFRIIKKADQTIARIEIPYNGNFQTVRKSGLTTRQDRQRVGFAP